MKINASWNPYISENIVFIDRQHASGPVIVSCSLRNVSSFFARGLMGHSPRKDTPMSGKTMLMAFALSAWLIVSVVAFLVVAYAGFFGIAVLGLLLWFI